MDVIYLAAYSGASESYVVGLVSAIHVLLQDVGVLLFLKN